MNKEILVLGKGFFGERISRYLDCAVWENKISTLEDALRVVAEFRPQALINCIGYTGRNVDDCELNKDKALFINSFIPLILAEAATRNKIKFVHISSGCIYHYDYKNNSPVTEERIPDFFELFYSRSKIYSEKPLELLSSKYNILILRPRVPLDNYPHPKNLLTKLINYKKAIDLPNTVTYMPDFLRALKHLIEKDCRGIYNTVNSGGLKYPDLLDEYKKYVPDFKYERVEFESLNLVRTNLILSTEKLERSGFKVRGINEVLQECVKSYVQS